MRSRRRSKGWGDGEEFTADPEEEIDFDEGLPSTVSKRRRSRSTPDPDLEIPLGEGKYQGTSLDFDEGLPDCRAVVNIAKAAAPEEADPEEVPLRIHKGGRVETRVSTPSPNESPRVDLKASESPEPDPVPAPQYDPTVSHVVRGVASYDHSLATATIKASPEPATTAPDVQPSDVLKRIVPRTRNGKREFCVEAESSGRSFGCYPTKGEAESRLRQVEGFAKSEKGLLPSVLSWEAVRKGAMPEEGSGLPSSLEQDVPPKFRFWKCSDPFDARAVRDALVEEGLFTSETVRKVNGELRRAVVETVEKLFLSPVYDGSEPVEVPPDVRPVEKVASLLEPSQGERETVLFDEQITGLLGIETILEKAGGLAADWVIAARDSELVRKAIGGPAFKLKSRADLVFATNATIEREGLIEWVQLERADELLKFAFSEGRTIPILKGKEERIVYGIVLEPDEVDSQKDTVSKQEIEQACHKFMEDFGGLGRQHQELVNGKLVLLENFIAPVDFEVDGQSVKAGSWLMKERVVDDQLWQAVKKGEYTGYSIGGSAVRKPVK